jgi:formyl-CoA transferase
MLEDLRVIEIGQVLAGPYAGAILADLGATVIKIEKPDGGDDGRRMGARSASTPNGSAPGTRA